MTQGRIILKDKESSCEIPNTEEINFPSPIAEESKPEESELSPRLTSMIEIGVVPESPIDTGQFFHLKTNLYDTYLIRKC